MIEQFNFDIRLIFAILNGKVSAAINRKLYRNFRQNGLEISPEQWTVLIFLWEKDGVTQQELCNATFKDKPRTGKELEEKARIIANRTLKEALHGITVEELSVSQEVLRKIFFNTKD